MSIGNHDQSHAALIDGALLAIKPDGAGTFLKVVEVGFSTEGVAGDIEIYRTDGVLPILIESSDALCTGYIGMPWRCTTDSWIEIKNNSGQTQTITYSTVEVEAAA